MRRTAFERVFYAKVTGEPSVLLMPFGEALHDAYIDYQESRKQCWKRLGLEKPYSKVALALFGFWIMRKRKRLVDKFNDEMDELAQAEIRLPSSPLPRSVLEAMNISTVDRVAMKELGVIDG